MQDGDAHSFYNPIEAATLVELVSSLLNQDSGQASVGRIQVEDIGVICTYRKQVGGRILHDD